MSAGISIGSLFMGGITVCILMGLFMMATVYIIAKKRGYPKHKRSSWSERIKSFFSALPALLSPVILLLINLLLFMGTFMETNASILILTPILMPIVTQIGVHPVQFGVIMIFALMIGLLTPPTSRSQHSA